MKKGGERLEVVYGEQDRRGTETGEYYL
jgi:hypothetical protein